MFSSWPKVHLYWIQELGVQDVLYSCHVQCPTFLAISSFKTSKTIFTGHAQKSNIANIPKSYGISHTSEHWQRRVSQYQIHNYMLSAWWRGSNVSELVRRLERCELFQRSRIGTLPISIYPCPWECTQALESHGHSWSGEDAGNLIFFAYPAWPYGGLHFWQCSRFWETGTKRVYQGGKGALFASTLIGSISIILACRRHPAVDPLLDVLTHRIPFASGWVLHRTNLPSNVILNVQIVEAFCLYVMLYSIYIAWALDFPRFSRVSPKTQKAYDYVTWVQVNVFDKKNSQWVVRFSKGAWKYTEVV